MKRLLRVLSFLILILTEFSCNRNPVYPEDNIPPGKRDYVWSIDSVDYGNIVGTIQLESTWGSSLTDIWGTGYTPNVRDCLWHYDGRKWARATEGTPIIGSGNGSRIVGRVWGSGSDDVWAIGGRIISGSQTSAPFVIHYDGREWTEVTGDITKMPNGCTSLYGVTKDEFWVADLENIVKYKNSIWQKYFVGENLLVWGINGSDGNIYAVGYDISAVGNRVIIFLIKNNQLSIIDETTLTDNFGHYNGKFEPSKLLVCNRKIYTAWHNISSTDIAADGSIDTLGWNKILSLTEGQYFVNTFFHNQKDFFVMGYPNLLYQYNGSDIQNIEITLRDTITLAGTYAAVWTNGDEIFVSDTENGIIYHGR